MRALYTTVLLALCVSTPFPMPLLPHSAPFFLDFLPFFLMPVNLTSDLYFALAPKINTTLMFNWAGIYRIICLAEDFARFRIIIFSSEYLGIRKASLTIIGKLLALLQAKRLAVWISKLGHLFAVSKSVF